MMWYCDPRMARDLQVIQTLLSQGKRSVRRSAAWDRICEASGCGTRRGQQIEFTIAETERLRNHGRLKLMTFPRPCGKQILWR